MGSTPTAGTTLNRNQRSTMAITLNQCPKCGKFQYRDIIIKVHDPDTKRMNMRATLQCQNEYCAHQWEGETVSPHFERQRKLGLVW